MDITIHSVTHFSVTGNEQLLLRQKIGYTISGAYFSKEPLFACRQGGVISCRHKLPSQRYAVSQISVPATCGQRRSSL